MWRQEKIYADIINQFLYDWMRADKIWIKT